MAHHQTRGGELYVVLKNRSRPAYLRLSASEYALLPLMDGSRTVGDLVVEYLLRERILAFQRVLGLVAQLERHHFLHGTHVDAYQILGQTLRRGDRLGRLLPALGAWLGGREVRFSGLEALVDAWYQCWAWVLFTRPAQTLFVGISALGLALFALGLWQGSQRLLALDGSYELGIVFLLATGFVATGVHELGHAFALRHVGREIRKGGLLFYYGMPTFFVDTTDVWMAGPPARLAVSWAGPYTALITGGVASIAAFLLHGSVTGDVLLAWAFVSYLDLLVNLNPLLELDGYYLLVDGLERPLLRRHALAFARGPLWKKLWRRESFSRDERLLALFGLASGVWSVFSVWFALYLWEARIETVVRELWRSENPVSRVALLGLGACFLALGALLLLRLGRLIAPWVVANSVLLARRAARLRRRDSVALLRTLPFLADLPDTRLVEIASLLRPLRVLPGDYVVREGEVGQWFYLVKSGDLDVVKQRHAVALIGPGGYFGEVALLGNVPRTASVVARSVCDLLMLRGEDFRALMGHEMSWFLRLRERVELRSELAQLDWLSGLGPTELDLLIAKLEPYTFQPGTTLVHQGEAGDRFYVIRSGRAEVVANGALVSTLGPGDYCGEIALLMNVPRTATVRVLGSRPVEAWGLGREEFGDVLAQYLGLAPALEDVGARRLEELGAA